MNKTPDTTYIKTKKSSIHNNGVFAAIDIPEGTRIIEYVGEKITKAQSLRRANEWDSHARTKGAGLVYIFELNKRYDIDGNFEYNPARHMNHSCSPNCEAVNIRGHIWIVALRDIPKGEELVYDYGYDFEDFLNHPCKCASSNCIGYIVREDQRKKVKRLLANKKKSN